MVFFIQARAVAKVPGVGDIYRVVEGWRDAIMAFAPQLLALLTASSLCTHAEEGACRASGRGVDM